MVAVKKRFLPIPVLKLYQNKFENFVFRFLKISQNFYYRCLGVLFLLQKSLLLIANRETTV